MNIYHLKIMHPGGTTYNERVWAESYDYKDSNCYVFYKQKLNNCLYVVASYPISFTIIESIDYDTK